jgi:sugar O-acyltransferase (sialic acid O-acetyltransferase NeuD family)
MTSFQVPQPAKPLAIYGAGGFGREMALMVEQMNAVRKEWDLIGFFDDGKREGETVEGFPILGDLQMLNEWSTPLALVLALANPVVRRDLVINIRNERIEFPVMIHPQSMTGSSRNKFGRGSIITAGCILTTGIDFGEFVIVNLSCTIGHDVKVGSHTSIMPGCNISGAIRIGERCLIGTGVQILQNLRVGDESRVGAGAVVVKDVASNKTVVGVPASERR